jgi:hypothetical protein
MQGTGFGCVRWVAYWVGLHEASHMADVEWGRLVCGTEKMAHGRVGCVEVVRASPLNGGRVWIWMGLIGRSVGMGGEGSG